MDTASDQPLVTAGTDHDADEVLLRLSQIDVLRALPPEEVQELVPHVEQLDFPAGHCLMQQGAAGDALYLIESGTARVERIGSKDVIRVGAGSVVGEGALLTGEPRSATVTADSALSVWRVSKEAFDRIVAASPNLKQALEALVEQRRTGVAVKIPSRAFWVSTGLRALEARYQGLHLW